MQQQYDYLIQNDTLHIYDNLGRLRSFLFPVYLWVSLYENHRFDFFCYLHVFRSFHSNITELKLAYWLCLTSYGM